MLSVDDFKAKLKGGGARANLFKVTLNYPAFVVGDVELTSFMVKNAAIPASTQGEVPVPFRGRTLYVAGDRTFDTWDTTIYNDTDYNVRNSLESWMNGINAHTENTGFSAPVDYQVDLLVDQLDRDENVLKRYVFRGAFPTALSAIDLAYDANDAVQEFTCTWRYQYWEAQRPETTT